MRETNDAPEGVELLLDILTEYPRVSIGTKGIIVS